MREVRVENGKVISTRIDEAENIKRTTILEMTKSEAEKQLSWISAEIKRAADEYEQAKHNMTPEGRKNLVFLEKQKAQQAREHKEEMEKLKEEYEKAIRSV